MNSGFNIAEAIIRLSDDTEERWNGFAFPIPENSVIYTVDSQKFKEGDGFHKYSDLPDGPSLAGIKANRTHMSDVLIKIGNGTDDLIINTVDGQFVPSTVKIDDFTSRIDTLLERYNFRDTRLTQIDTTFNTVNNITVTDESKLALTGSGNIQPGLLPLNLIPAAAVSPPICILNMGVYSDVWCTVPAASLLPDTSYFVKIEATHDQVDVDILRYNLVSDNSFLTIHGVARNIFRVDVRESPINTTVKLTTTVSHVTDSETMSMMLPLIGFVDQPLAVNNIAVFTDPACTVPAGALAADSTYYVKINASFGNTDISRITFALSNTNPNLTITEIGNGIFKVVVAEPSGAGLTTLTGSASFGALASSSATTVSVAQYIPTLTITKIDLYSDIECLNPETRLAADSTYYAKIRATFGNLTIDKIAFTLSDNSVYTTITKIGVDFFKIQVGEPLNDVMTVFTAGISYSTASSTYITSVQLLQYVPALSITGIDIFSDAGCTNLATKFVGFTTYYVKINATYGNLAIGQLLFLLTDNSTFTTITPVGNGIFKVDVGETSAGTVTLTATIGYSTAQSMLMKNVALVQYLPNLVINNIKFYDDAICTVISTALKADSSFYAKVSAAYGNLTVNKLAFTLTDTNNYTDITALGSGVFRIDVAEPPTNDLATFEAGVSYSTVSANGFASIPISQYVPVMSVTSIGIYNDYACTIAATQFSADASYFVKVKATYGNLNISQILFDLTDTNNNTIITPLGSGLFRVDVGESTVTQSMTLTGSASYSTASAFGTASITIAQYIPVITIQSFKIYADVDCTVPATQFAADTSYYAKFTTTQGNLTPSWLTYAITDNSANTTITKIGVGLFRIDVGEASAIETATLSYSASYSSASVSGSMYVPVLQYVPVITVDSISTFSDASCTNAITQFAADSTYYAKINATFGNLTIDKIAFGLSSNNGYAVVTPYSQNIFKVTISEPPNAGGVVTLSGTASYSSASASGSKAVTLLQYIPPVVVTAVDIFSNSGYTDVATQLNADTYYWVRITATYGNLNLSQITFNLWTDNGYATIVANYGNGYYAIRIAEPSAAASVTLTGTAAYLTSNGSKTKALWMPQYIPAMWITDIGVFTDAGCTNRVGAMYADTYYYVRVLASYGNLSIGQVAFGLSSNNGYAPVVANYGNGLFLIHVTEPNVAYTLTLTGAVYYSTASASSAGNIYLAQYVPPVYVTGIGVYTEGSWSNSVGTIYPDTTYYVRVFGSYGNLDISQITFGLSSNNGYVQIIANWGNGYYAIHVYEPPIAYGVTLYASVAYGSAASGSGSVWLYAPAYNPPPWIVINSVTPWDPDHGSDLYYGYWGVYGNYWVTEKMYGNETVTMTVNISSNIPAGQISFSVTEMQDLGVYGYRIIQDNGGWISNAGGGTFYFGVPMISYGEWSLDYSIEYLHFTAAYGSAYATYDQLVWVMGSGWTYVFVG